MSNEFILTMEQINKSFSGVQVLYDVQLNLKKGTVHALMGENGAGKSTLMNILNGVLKPDTGKITIGGKEVKINNVNDAISNGISMIHQELTPILEMTVAENIFLGREYSKKISAILDDKKTVAETEKLLEDLDIKIDPNAKLIDLSVAQMQMVEIVKAVSNDAEIIIMDEPTSAITEAEIKKLFKIINNLKNQGKSIIYISHKLDEVFEISDYITVLRDGKYIMTDKTENLNSNKLISAMVGRELEDGYNREKSKIGKVKLEVKSLSKKGKFKDISFKLYEGEILGFAGLVGAGRTELMEAIYGFKPADSGEIFIDNKKVNINTPKDGIESKIAFVPEDRKEVGLNLLGSIKENITLSNLKEYCNWNFIINSKKENIVSKDYIKRFKIRCSSKDMDTKYLSGGNQQKVVLAKCISCDPEIIIMDEPTRGIDVGAKAEIYKMMDEMVKNGRSIIMVSSDMPEILSMSDRIIVLSQGVITGEFSRKEFNQEDIMTCASAQLKGVM